MKNSAFPYLSFLTPIMALAVTSCLAAMEEPIDTLEEALPSLRAPPVPPALAVPRSHHLAFVYDAAGVQIYDCQNTATGYGWVFRAPEARLFARNGRVAGTHYAGPTWESRDGSQVVGTKVAEAAGGPDDIPWLLLRAVDHDGEGRMQKVTFLQRLETAGGKAPVAGCDADHLGTTARVDYAATYFFYAARGKH